MSQLLVIETSPRGETSISRQMTRHFVKSWQSVHPQGAVTFRDLANTSLPFVDANWLQAYFTPPANQSQAMKDALQLSDELIEELLACSHLVIGTPVYNYNVPGALKAWFDHIVRKGLTIGFDGKGLIVNTQATLLIASGGVYTEGSPIRDRDIATQYLKLMMNVIGINDVNVVSGGGAKLVDMKETTMDSFIAKLQPELSRAAER